METHSGVAKLLTVHLMRHSIGSALCAVWAERRGADELRATPGLLHAQPFATSNMFLATAGRLGMLCAWESASAADAFLSDSPVLDSLTKGARRGADIRLQPVHAKGTWNGVAFSADDAAPLRDDEPVLAFVHGRLRPRYAARFYRANLRVARFAARQPGFLGALGVHETPLRFASLSWWRSVADAHRYAYAPGEHQPVVRPYKEVPWADDWCTVRRRSLGPDELLL